MSFVSLLAHSCDKVLVLQQLEYIPTLVGEKGEKDGKCGLLKGKSIGANNVYR